MRSRKGPPFPGKVRVEAPTKRGQDGGGRSGWGEARNGAQQAFALTMSDLWCQTAPRRSSDRVAGKKERARRRHSSVLVRQGRRAAFWSPYPWPETVTLYIPISPPSRGCRVVLNGYTRQNYPLKTGLADRVKAVAWRVDIVAL